MLGNLKLYLGASPLDRYSAWLRNVGEPALQRQTLLWTVRIVLIAAVAVHICAA
jgi:succinate dehydrogenase / fumarate reductase cytochrome b subunit